MIPKSSVVILQQTGEINYLEINLGGQLIELPGIEIEAYGVKIIGAYGQETISLDINTKVYTYKASFGGGNIEINGEFLIPLKFATISEKALVDSVPEKWADLDFLKISELESMAFYATILPDPENPEFEYDYKLIVENGEFVE